MVFVLGNTQPTSFHMFTQISAVIKKCKHGRVAQTYKVSQCERGNSLEIYMVMSLKMYTNIWKIHV